MKNKKFHRIRLLPSIFRCNNEDDTFIRGFLTYKEAMLYMDYCVGNIPSNRIREKAFKDGTWDKIKLPEWTNGGYYMKYVEVDFI